jgi:hypothetical protein
MQHVKNTKAVIERMIDHFTGIEETQTSKETETATDNPKQIPAVERGRQLCMFDVLGERRNTA